MSDGIDVDRIAERAQRLGIVEPDRQDPDEDCDADEVLVVVHIAGGLLADCGSRRRDIPRLRVIVVDEDVLEEDEEQGVWTETPTALEDWLRGPEDALCRARPELPDHVIAELGLLGPTPRPTDDAD